MLKKLFLSMMAIAVLGLGFVACSDDDDEEEEKIVNTYKYENLYGRTFSWTGKTQSESDMTQYITIQDESTVVYQHIIDNSKVSATAKNPHTIADCTLTNPSANVYVVTGKEGDTSYTLKFTLKGSESFDFNLNSIDYEGFAVYEPLKDLYNVEYTCAGEATTQYITVKDSKTIHYKHTVAARNNAAVVDDDYYYKLVKTTVTSGDSTVDAYKTVWYKDSDLTEASGQTVTFSAITAGTGFTANIDSGHGTSGGTDYSFTKTSSE